jgi:hypothetical protein
MLQYNNMQIIWVLSNELLPDILLPDIVLLGQLLRGNIPIGGDLPKNSSGVPKVSNEESLQVHDANQAA